MAKKTRVEIPPELSARVLFEADRTCCVCYQRKPVQIHHIDDNPANNQHQNLAVLCFDCHRETQIRGGFDRKLDAEQIKLYRRDWLEQVRRYRSIREPEESIAQSGTVPDVRLIAAELEIYKAREDWFQVARIYDTIGDIDLRDKYLALAATEDLSPFYKLLFAKLQGRIDQVSDEIKTAAAAEVADDWTINGSVLSDCGRPAEAASVFMKGIQGALDSENWFAAAFHMRHALNSAVVDQLFRMSLHAAVEKDDLWGQVRVYEELGFEDAKRELLLGHERDILQSRNPWLIKALAIAKGDGDLLLKVTKEIAEAGGIYMVVIDDDESGDEESQAEGDFAGLRREDRRVIKEMIKAGADLSKPRHVVYYLYFSTEQIAQTVSSEAQTAGFEVTIRKPRSKEDGGWAVICGRHGTVLTAESVREMSDLFQSLASRHDGLYDGWEASV